MRAQRIGRAVVLAALLFNVALAGAVSVRAATLGAGCGEKSNGNVSVSSTTFGNVDAALSHTITTNGGRVLFTFSGTGAAAGGDGLALDVAVDGTRLGTSLGLTYTYNNSNGLDVSFSGITGALAAGSHTVALQARSINGGSMTLYAGGSGQPPARFCAHELPTDTAEGGSGSLDGDVSLVAFEGDAAAVVQELRDLVFLVGGIALALLTALLVATGLRRHG